MDSMTVLHTLGTGMVHELMVRGATIQQAGRREYLKKIFF